MSANASKLSYPRYSPHIEAEDIPDQFDGTTNKPSKKDDVRQKQINRLSRVQRNFKIAMLSAVTVNEIQEIMQTLVDHAKRGNISAAKEVLDRCVGKTSEQEVIERLAELEALVLKEASRDPA